MSATEPVPPVPSAPDLLREALEREHREIDAGIESFAASGGGHGPSTPLLRDAIAALRRHIYLEEEFLFPPLRAAGMVAPVFVMLSEHRELWRTMELVDDLLDAGAPARDLRESCSTLLAQLDRHNSKEEPIIYGQAATVLPTEEQTRLLDFLDHAELPEGWACTGK